MNFYGVSHLNNNRKHTIFTHIWNMHQSEPYSGSQSKHVSNVYNRINYINLLIIESITLIKNVSGKPLGIWKLSNSLSEIHWSIKKSQG